MIHVQDEVVIIDGFDWIKIRIKLSSSKLCYFTFSRCKVANAHREKTSLQMDNCVMHLHQSIIFGFGFWAKIYFINIHFMAYV
jgi:hypothetical protein